MSQYYPSQYEHLACSADITDLFTIDIALTLLPSPNTSPPDIVHFLAKVTNDNEVIIESKTTTRSGSDSSWLLEMESELCVIL